MTPDVRRVLPRQSEEGEHFEGCGDAKITLFDFIEVFYNQWRRHSTLGQISPAEFERRAATRPVRRSPGSRER